MPAKTPKTTRKNSRVEIRDTGITVTEFPMAWFHRQLIEGASEQMRRTLNVAEAAVRTGDTSALKEGVDPIVLLMGQAELLGQAKLILRLDTEASARAAK